MDEHVMTLAAPGMDSIHDRAGSAAGETAALADDAREPFRRMLHRLAETLDAETQALGRNELERLGEASRMKSLGLLELNRSIVAARLFDGATLDAGARAQLSGLQEALERNLAALQLRLRAVRHVAAIIARAIEDHESDGTYTIGPAPGGGGR